MRYIPLLLLLTSCSCMFRGTLIDIDELSFSPAWKEKPKTEIIKEVITEDQGK